jgi:hypothetical protein
MFTELGNLGVRVVFNQIDPATPLRRPFQYPRRSRRKPKIRRFPMPTRSRRFNRVLLGAVAAIAVTCASTSAATPPPAPTATTGGASSVTYQSAALTSTVNPNGAATEVYFEYGTTTAYGVSSAPDALPAGSKLVAVSANITGLVAYTKYDYRVVAVSANGTTKGNNHTFTTAKIPLSIQIAADPSPGLYDGLVTIEGTLAGTGNANQPVALQQNPYPYTAGFTQLGNTELTSSTGAYMFTIPSLSISTQFRVVNVNHPTVISPAIGEGDAVVATLQTQRKGTHSHPAARFFGTVSPGIETDAKIAIERLEGTSWQTVAGTITSNTSSNGVTKYSVVVHFKHPGFYHVFVQPVEGSHVVGRSGPLYVRGYK